MCKILCYSFGMSIVGLCSQVLAKQSILDFGAVQQQSLHVCMLSLFLLLSCSPPPSIRKLLLNTRAPWKDRITGCILGHVVQYEHKERLQFPRSHKTQGEWLCVFYQASREGLGQLAPGGERVRTSVQVPPAFLDPSQRRRLYSSLPISVGQNKKVNRRSPAHYSFMPPEQAVHQDLMVYIKIQFIIGPSIPNSLQQFWSCWSSSLHFF